MEGLALLISFKSLSDSFLSFVFFSFLPKHIWLVWAS
nr:MAG TPA: hypothetical protein [Caudoviricetes sp.]